MTSLKYFLIAAVFAAGGCASPHQMNQHDHGQTDTRSANNHVQSALAVPSSIRIEHQHLHHELDAALSADGKTAAAAREVANVLLPHFKQEEAYAMPPLGLLERLARNEPIDSDDMKRAIEMSERLRREYSKMLEEHKSLTLALRKLAAAAKEENKPEQAAFAEALIAHAQNEEQVLYPATLLIGEDLKLRQNNR